MFTNKDLVHLKNLQRLLAKAKMELEGQEILAAADVLRWVGLLEHKVQEDLQRQEIQAKIAQGTEKITVPEPAPQPESLPDKPKRRKSSGS